MYKISQDEFDRLDKIKKSKGGFKRAVRQIQHARLWYRVSCNMPLCIKISLSFLISEVLYIKVDALHFMDRKMSKRFTS